MINLVQGPEWSLRWEFYLRGSSRTTSNKNIHEIHCHRKSLNEPQAVAAAECSAEPSSSFIKLASLLSLLDFRCAPSGEPVICEVPSAWTNWRAKAITRIIQARAWLYLSSIITWRACFSERLQWHIQTKTILFSGWLPHSFGRVTSAPVEKWYSSCSGPGACGINKDVATETGNSSKCA